MRIALWLLEQHGSSGAVPILLITKALGEKGNLMNLEASWWNHFFALWCFSEVGKGTKGQKEQGDVFMRKFENRMCP